MANIDIRAVWHGEQVQQGIERTASAFRSLGAVAAGLGIAFGLNEIRSAIQATIKDTAAEERGVVRLAASLRNLGVSAQSIVQINDYIGQLQDSTQFADDEIVAAFTRMTQATSDANGSLANLTDAMDIAAATGKSLEESGQIVAMAMEGQVRALGQLLPSLKTYLENLEGVEDPAQRAALAMQALRGAFGRSAKADLDSIDGSIDAMKNSFLELGNVLTKQSGILEWMTKFADAAHVWAVALREHITLAEAVSRVEAKPKAPTVAQTAPTGGGAVGGGASGTPAGSRGGSIFESAFGEIGVPANNRQRGSRNSRLAEMLKQINTEVATDYTEQMRKAEEAFAEAHRQQMHAIGESLKSGLLGAFDAATQGGKSFVDYMKNYVKQALLELAAGSLINALLPGAGVGTGILGGLFGKHGASQSIERNLAMRRMRLS